MAETRLNSIGTGILRVFDWSDRVTDWWFALGEGLGWSKQGVTRLAQDSWKTAIDQNVSQNGV